MLINPFEIGANDCRRLSHSDVLATENAGALTRSPWSRAFLYCHTGESRYPRQGGSRRAPGRQICWPQPRSETSRMIWFLQRCRALGAALVLLVPTIAAAAAPVPAVLTPPDTLQLQRIAAYLNGIRTM